MKGDFSRISFDPTNHFSSVLLQQGRVTLDADANEQGAILLHYLRTLARDLIGPRGGPADNLGFRLRLDTTDAANPKLKIGAGRYYVDGILVENDTECDYAKQPDRAVLADDPLLKRLKGQSNADVWLYLDVWEQHVTSIENDAIREPALNGPDTCTRTKVVWQVRGIARDALLENLQAKQAEVDTKLANPNLTPLQRQALELQKAKLANDVDLLTPGEGDAGNDCAAPLDSLVGLSDAQLTARLDPGALPKDPCIIAPDALYRGIENQLYRVEIHRGSAAGVAPTFKWSRDNASVATRWLGTEPTAGGQGIDLKVASSRGFSAGAWVEIGDDAHDDSGDPGMLVKLSKVQGDRLSVDPASVPTGQALVLTPDMSNAKVRRWDQRETEDITLALGAVPVVEASATAANWIDLEDGIQLQFAPGGSYRSGDYWLIAARTNGSIDWPRTLKADGSTQWHPKRPRGVEHHYAPLAFVGLNNQNELATTACLCEILPINSCAVDSELRPPPVPGPAPRGPGRRRPPSPP